MSEKHASTKPVLDEAVLNRLSAAVKPTALSAEREAAMRTRLFNRLKTPAPKGTYTVQANTREWIAIDPLVEIKILREDLENNNQTALWRLKPGAVVATHSHTQEEECLVLDGEIYIGDHCVRKGDLHVAEPGYSHPSIASKTGALLLVRGQRVESIRVESA